MPETAAIGELATHASQLLSAAGYDADFTPGSLGEIERFCAEPHVPLRETFGVEASDASRLLGSYVGEVLRRNLKRCSTRSIG